ncbi:Solute carrier family 41 member 1 [Hypsizygus marmoreus]|uniref:Solute carrier family 41 member 1 n=1 Tax=Hypsizygus marmoreus TaxID=39966 RepID=A0A369JDA2_HYPMA|nr:Solute carrier family 41 member 1 [Hypsizygus marmoreus]
MNPKSPGNGLVDDDIEMIGLEDVAERPPHANDTKHLPPVHTEDEEDEDDHDLGEDSRRALLNSNERSHATDPLKLSTGKLWPQIKSIVIESAPTLLLTTVGLLFTGKLLDRVSHWRAMKEVHQLIMIIPVVLNLKGNLEMNLSARLGTAANVGELDDPAVRRSMITGNLSLLQVQAAVVSFIAACIALVVGLALPRITPNPPPGQQTSGNPLVHLAARAVYRILDSDSVLDPRRPLPPLPKDGYSKITFPKLVMVASTAMTSACLSSIVLGSFMCTLIVLCRRYGRDPDNIAPPIASCLGDLVTLCFIGITSTLLIRVIHTPIPFILASLIVLFAVVCFAYTVRNDHVRPLLTQGWTPLFGAMVISSATGIVLDRFVSRYEGFALLAVVISGLPGSVGSILVSRVSTSLHAAALSITPMTADGRPEPSTQLVMITLLFITLPVEVIFLAVLHGLGWLRLPMLFVAFSVVFFFLAVLISLYVARFLTNFLWAKQRDPDMYALPIHSALMDLVGQLLLVICFEIVQLFIPPMRVQAGD